MRLTNNLFFLGVIFLLKQKTYGRKQRMFLEKYKDEIQKYIMAGHEKGWTHCDILSADSFSNEDQPQISMELDKIKTLNVGSIYAFSNCLLVSYHVSSLFSLENLIDFGKAAIQHIRLALVVKMDSGITLNMIANTTKLPFMIAAEIASGREQFLCPVVGEVNPKLEEDMCNPSYTSYKKRKLRVTCMGFPPYFIQTNADQFDGIDIRLMRILENKLNFRAEIIAGQSHMDPEIKVQERDVDISIKQEDYSSSFFQTSEFIGPITSHNFHFLTAAPETRKNYLTLFRPFDSYVWGLLITSVVAVSLSLTIINKMNNKWSNQPLKETPFQSKDIHSG